MSRAAPRPGRVPGRRLGVLIGALLVLGALTVATAPSVRAAGPPTITSLSPSSLPQGVAAVPVTLTGTNFQSGAIVTSKAGITATATFVSDTQLDLVVDVAGTVPPGSYNLFVTNPDQSMGSCTNCLTVTVGAIPTVTSLTPDTLPPGVANQMVTMNGTDFQPGAVVTSHIGINATVTFVSADQLDLSVNVAPTVPSGLYDVFVNNPDHSLGRCINCLSIGVAAKNPLRALTWASPRPRRVRLLAGRLGR